MGGILQKVDKNLEWIVPNGDWKLRCSNISSDVPEVGWGNRWFKVMTVDPVLALEPEICSGIIPSENEIKKHLDTAGPGKNIAAPEIHLENYGGGGEGDVRRISIAEEPSQEISKNPESTPHVVATEPGETDDGTPSSSKTVTPSYTKTANTARESRSSSRRSSGSLPTIRSPNPPGGPELAAVRFEVTTEVRLANRPNMDWTRGAMLRKNTQNLAGMDEHLNFLIHAPW